MNILHLPPNLLEAQIFDRIYAGSKRAVKIIKTFSVQASRNFFNPVSRQSVNFLSLDRRENRNRRLIFGASDEK